jgi:hypothetical protein
VASPGRGPVPPGLPSPHPRPRPERPPLTQRRRDTDCAGKAALLRRAAAEAAGGAGGTATETPRSVRPEPLPWGGPLQPGVGERCARLRPHPLPGEGRGRPHFPGPRLEGAPRGGRKTRTPISASRLREPEWRGGSVPRDFFAKPGTILGRATPFLPNPTWARGRTSLRGRDPDPVRFGRHPSCLRSSAPEPAALGALRGAGSAHSSSPEAFRGPDTPPTPLHLGEPAPPLSATLNLIHTPSQN